MKYTILVIASILLIGCNNAPKTNIKSLDNNSSYKKFLCTEWQLVSSSCRTARKSEDEIEIVRMDSIPNDFCIYFKTNGKLMNDNLIIGKWSLEKKRIAINGKNKVGIFLDLNSFYVIDRLDSMYMEISKYYFDENHKISLRMSYQFINKTRLTNKRNKAEDIEI